MDSDIESAFVVHSDPVMRFVKQQNRLYTLDNNTKTNSTYVNDSYSFHLTSTDRAKLFTPKQLSEAEKAYSLYKTTTLSPSNKFKEVIRQNRITNADTTVEAFERYEFIYGKDTSNLRGRTVRQKPSPIEEFFPIPLPGNILRQVLNVNISIDIFYFLGCTFIHSISRGIHFVTTEAIQDEKTDTLRKSVERILNIYRSRGLKPSVINADNQFACIQNLVDCRIDCVAKNEHVSDVERSIRTQEEHTRTLIQRVPFTSLPRAMAESAAICPSIYRNAFPNPSNGITKDLSPRTIVMGQGNLDAKKDLLLQWGSYCEVHEQNSITNDDRARTVPAIALHPSNHNGGYYFMSLDTGMVISRNRWTEMVITPDIISRVHTIAQNEGAKTIAKQSRLFHISTSDANSLEERGDHDYHYESDHDDEYDPQDYSSDVDPADLSDDNAFPVPFTTTTGLSSDATPSAPPDERSAHEQTTATFNHESNYHDSEEESTTSADYSEEELSASTNEPHTDTDREPHTDMDDAKSASTNEPHTDTDSEHHTNLASNAEDPSEH